MAHEIRLRPITPADTELLVSVYGSTREEELAVVPWTAEQKAAFIRMQFDAQSTHYQKHYPDAQFSIIESRQQPAGRLYVFRGEREIRLVDIALLPAHRGSGIGSTLLADLMDEARAARKSLTIHVERENRAQRLYRRLGFVPIGETGAYLLLEWKPETSAQTQTSAT